MNQTWARSFGVACVLICAQMLCAEPIAECELQTLPTPAKQEAYDFQFAMTQPAAEDAMDKYRLDVSDDPSADSSDMSRVFARLQTPTGDLEIGITITVNGKPYRQIRETWIDEASKWQSDPPSDKGADSDPKEIDTTTEESTESEVSEEATRFSGGKGSAGEKAVAHQKPGLRERILKYASRTGGIDREEASWLVSHWVGPAVLELREGISRQRYGVAPLLSALDEDGDGELSGEEFGGAAAKISQLDWNQDDELEMDELLQFSSSRENEPRKISKSWYPTHLLEVGSGDSSSIPDIEFAVSIGGENAGVTLLRTPADSAVHAAKDVIVLDLGACQLELSALETAESMVEANLGQISIGAVADGYPLFRLCDLDGDRRLSLREMRSADGKLASLDRNQDQALTGEEIPVPLRLAVATGPNVHRALSEPTHVKIEAAPNDVAAPGWFLTMDANHDGDLSRGEFLGDDAQFASLDTDGDGLINTGEARAN